MRPLDNKEASFCAWLAVCGSGRAITVRVNIAFLVHAVLAGQAINRSRGRAR